MATVTSTFCMPSMSLACRLLRLLAYTKRARELPARASRPAALPAMSPVMPPLTALLESAAFA